MVNRAIPPKIFTDFNLTLNGIDDYSMDNGAKLFCIPSKGNEIIKLDIILPFGRINETIPAQSKTYFNNLLSGSTAFSSKEFHEKMDYYGAVTNIKSGLDKSILSILSLKKYFNEVLDVWHKMVTTATFPNEQLKQKKDISIQKLNRQLAKNNVISYRELSSDIFGENSPYGYNTTPDHIQMIRKKDIEDFHAMHFSFSNATFILSGDVNETTIAVINKVFVKNDQKKIAETLYKQINSKPKKQRIKGIQKNQSSVRLGRRLFPKSHPDFYAMEFLSVVLGGYFGSRLVSNLREDKGYCYHIDSTLDTMVHDGCLYISADVGNKFVTNTIDEIHFELNRLRNETIPHEELALVKNYLKGQLLTLIDGPFAKSGLIKNYISSNIAFTDFNSFSSFIRSVSAEYLKEIANKYLNPSDFNLCIVGQLHNEE